MSGTSGIIVVSDLDWTMVNHHQSPDHTDLQTFNSTWKKIVEKNPDSMLVYSSGRSPMLYEELAGEVPLLTPDILVCSVGTEMLFLNNASKQSIHDAWEEYLNGQGWNREIVQGVVSDMAFDGLEISLQQESEQRPHKVSYKVRGEDVGRLVDAIRSTLERSHGMLVNVIYSGGEDLDVLPLRASKGKALEFFLKHGHVHDAPVLVCGDSGNDVELFQVPGVYGCIVANAHTELREWYETYGKENDKMFFCTKQGPAGIVECLGHFGFITQP
jgi:sucrose-6F-phosphate phosphohydrolase